ncbi:predicted protein [Pyrenophora tritici-repentis Pt-1C-BFP]|uniref:Uncharacterized protein n=1 Tax=Pyrenophora tritici-repentis (strain Pt-1C-BFP) TaxID=426418 RepID=B2WJ46_PYRTR|nr:uncharacterized protein PTRG_10005 [Pyrenophora tritici-repentis Pt-1C-BFP]EDU43056.1 predicted protein [Pyrenophora tritici-repentis Pt-1C-BFP]
MSLCTQGDYVASSACKTASAFGFGMIGVCAYATKGDGSFLGFKVKPVAAAGTAIHFMAYAGLSGDPLNLKWAGRRRRGGVHRCSVLLGLLSLPVEKILIEIHLVAFGL